MKIIGQIALGFALTVIAGQVYAQAQKTSPKRQPDEFAAVRCDADIVHALVGRQPSDGRVRAVEAAHRDIQLKNIGGSEASDSLFLGGWAICGRDFQLLESPRRIDDVIEFPSHSRRYPAFFGTCHLEGKELKDGVIAILDNPSPRAVGTPPYQPTDTTSLSPRVAWRIDEVHRKFVELPVERLRCPRGRIFTIDGGM